MAPPQPFQIRIAEDTLVDLRDRLRATRWPDAIDGAAWQFGPDLQFMRELAAYWKDTFDWRRQEARLNRFDHFRMPLDGRLVHFIHQRSPEPAAMPIVLTHGWPGSFVEFLELIPRLTDPRAHGNDPADAFHVVVPSLPGYGFSEPSTIPGMNVFRIAALWRQLMTALGYGRFAVQGGDWGASVSTALGLQHASAVIGIHLNYIPGSFSPFNGAGAKPFTDEELTFITSKARWQQEHGAYAHAQGTKPQALAFGLSDSPIGLAAWIVDKLRDWSDCGGDVETRFSKDEILTNITIYWVTRSIHSSMRLYAETRQTALQFSETDRVSVPCGIARFAKEAPFPPRSWIERGYNVQQWTEFPRGGHFAAWEEPELLADDIRAFFRAHGASGRDPALLRP